MQCYNQVKKAENRTVQSFQNLIQHDNSVNQTGGDETGKNQVTTKGQAHEGTPGKAAQVVPRGTSPKGVRAGIKRTSQLDGIHILVPIVA